MKSTSYIKFVRGIHGTSSRSPLLMFASNDLMLVDGLTYHLNHKNHTALCELVMFDANNTLNYWYQADIQHDQFHIPAVINVVIDNGRVQYNYLKNKLHSEIGPAVTFMRDEQKKPIAQFWYRHDEMCRGGHLPTIVLALNDTEWYFYNDNDIYGAPLDLFNNIIDKIENRS